jgi:hypothetical protein
MPKTLGGLANKARAVQQERLALQKKVDELKKFELDLCEKILTMSTKARVSVARGTTGQVSFRPDPFPVLDDPQAFYAHLQQTGEFELLERRLKKDSFRERWEDGKDVPGTRRETKIRFTVSGVKPR